MSGEKVSLKVISQVSGALSAFCVLLWLIMTLYAFPINEGSALASEIRTHDKDIGRLQKWNLRLQERIEKIQKDTSEIKADQRVQGRDIKSILDALRKR
jgi:peptidoglycan hydrolase CwlO-like protein